MSSGGERCRPVNLRDAGPCRRQYAEFTRGTAVPFSPASSLPPVSVSIRPLTELSQLQNEAIRPAAEAWQWLQENFQTNN